jgi:hypothetical protein
MVIFLIIAGGFALLAGGATWAVVRLQRIEIVESKREFDLYKLAAETSVADAKKEGLKAGEAAANALVRAAELEKETVSLKLGVATADARAKEAELKLLWLRKQMEPRVIDGEAFVSAIKGRPKSKVELLYVREDPDSFKLAQQIFWYLANAGWDCALETPILPPPAESPDQHSPLAWSVVARETGVSMVVRADADKQMQSDTAYSALWKAFEATGIETGKGEDWRMPDGVIRIVVAPRPLPSVTP